MPPDDAASPSSDLDRFLKAVQPRIKRQLAAHRIPLEDAEDVLQQALLALVTQWSSIREPEAWLTVTLERHCHLYWRRHRRQLYSAVDSALLEFLSQPVAPRQERDALMQDLQAVLERMPARCRRLLDLRFRSGYDPSEVARQMGYRESSITKVTSRCLAALARQLVVAAPRPAGGIAAAPPVTSGAGAIGAAGVPVVAPPAAAGRGRRGASSQRRLREPLAP